jgi:2-keto-3-deoxy-L-rhamnonate aldolase RhmA
MMRRLSLFGVVCLTVGLTAAWLQAQGQGGAPGAPAGRGGAAAAPAGQGGAAPAAPAAGGRGGILAPDGKFGTFAPWVPDAARPMGYAVRNSMDNPTGKLFNTAKAKLLAGQEIHAWTQSRPDPAEYCMYAPHYDYVWIEMQHSTLNYSDTEKMIAACPGVGVPIIRVPDAEEENIQKAMDMGALGIIVPQVDDPFKAFDGGMFAKYPPLGRRSSGGGQFGQIWNAPGINYRQNINDNVLVITMIESPIGAQYAYQIASMPGVDVVIVGSADLSNYSGYQAQDPRYQDLVLKVHDGALKAGKYFGTASGEYRSGTPISNDVKFTQNGPPNDGWTPPARGTGPGGAAPAAGGPPARGAAPAAPPAGGGRGTPPAGR